MDFLSDATYEWVGIVVERANGGNALTRVRGKLYIARGLPKVICAVNDKESCGRNMLSWAHCHGLALRLIELAILDEIA